MIAETLVTMRRCFDVVQRDVAKLDEAMRKRFGGAGGDGPAPDLNLDFAGTTCGDCGGTMQLYTRNDRPSLRCDQCETWWPLPDRQGVTIEPRSATCPLCQFQLVDVQFDPNGEEAAPLPALLYRAAPGRARRIKWRAHGLPRLRPCRL